MIIVGLAAGDAAGSGRRRITVYAVAIVAGTTVQLLYLLPSMRGKGPFPFSLGIGNREVRRVLLLMLPVTLGLGLINVNLLGGHGRSRAS